VRATKSARTPNVPAQRSSPMMALSPMVSLTSTRNPAPIHSHPSDSVMVATEIDQKSHKRAASETVCDRVMRAWWLEDEDESLHTLENVREKIQQCVIKGCGARDREITCLP
jgi:hypothetical protein